MRCATARRVLAYRPLQASRLAVPLASAPPACPSAMPNSPYRGLSVDAKETGTATRTEAEPQVRVDTLDSTFRDAVGRTRCSTQ
jgi:hypothetical protein